jgi:hypothetical protein
MTWPAPNSPPARPPKVQRRRAAARAECPRSAAVLGRSNAASRAALANTHSLANPGQAPARRSLGTGGCRPALPGRFVAASPVQTSEMSRAHAPALRSEFRPQAVCKPPAPPEKESLTHTPKPERLLTNPDRMNRMNRINTKGRTRNPCRSCRRRPNRPRSPDPQTQIHERRNCPAGTGAVRGTSAIHGGESARGPRSCSPP